MVPIGPRPVLWHVMRYYAHFGHNDFVLCLGYKGEVIKDYFLRYNEAVSNDFVLRRAVAVVELLSTDIQDWRITFVDTGLEATIGQRLMAVRRHVEDEEMFLANYADVLTDAPLDRARRRLPEPRQGRRVHLASGPHYTFHIVATDGERHRPSIRHVSERDVWINGGYFILRREIFDYIRPGEELVEAPFQRLDRGGPAPRLPLRGVLGADGHPQGDAAPRGAVRGRSTTVGRLSTARRTRRPDDARPSSMRGGGRCGGPCVR